jgi:hypothetical protein
MPPSGLPTGTVSSGRDGPSSAHDAVETDTETRRRIAELERENEALREAVVQQRRENERIVERYERLLNCGPGDGDRDAERDRSREGDDASTLSPSGRIAAGLRRIARAFDG